MTTNKQALMPCPFCGSTNLYERRINGGHGESDAHIACLNCGAMGPSDYGRDHNAAWNNRAELAAVTAERDGLLATATLVTDGWKLVPVEPTTDMKQAVLKVDIGDDDDIVLTWEEIERLYRALLNAAPPKDQGHE